VCEAGHDGKRWAEEDLKKVRFAPIENEIRLTGTEDIEVIASDRRTEPRGRIERGGSLDIVGGFGGVAGCDTGYFS
jgi:hypothetical protein